MASTVFLSFSRPAFHKPLVSGSFLPFKSRSLPCSSYTSSLSDVSVPRRSGGSYAAGSCSMGSGRMGLQWRNGNVSLLSFSGAPTKTDNGAPTKTDNGAPTKMDNGASTKKDTSQVLSALLPFVVALTALAALSIPSTFTWVSKEFYAPCLGGIMLSTGIQLSVNDYALAFKRPLPLTVGFLAHYLIKPLLGVLVANIFGISPTFYSGFVLTACVAGAPLSSYASFLSKGDVALSILLTSSTTIASVIFTPWLSRLLIGSLVDVNAIDMSKSILQVVLVPVTLGLALNTYAKPFVIFLRPVMPFVAMVCTSLCIGSPLSVNQTQILSANGLSLILPIVTFHAVAFALGYWFSKVPAFRQEEEVSRTISLCTGMQSSTLAGVLATQFLVSSHMVPPTCSVVIMAIMGLCLASFWGNEFRIRDIPLLLTPQNNGSSKL